MKECHTKKVTHKEVIHYLSCGFKHEIKIRLYKLDWWQKKKNVKKDIKQFFTNSDADEVEAITDVKKSRKVNYKIH